MIDAAELAHLAIAGCLTALAALVVQRVTGRASFATRATALHALTVILLVFSVIRLLPALPASLGNDGSRVSVAAAWLHAPGIVAPPAVQRLVVASRSDVLSVGASLVVVSWLAGAILMLARMLLGVRALANIRSRSTSSVIGAVHLRSALQPSRRERFVPVMVSDEIDVPCVAGWWSPAIMAPAASASWTASEWRVVLLHETSHLVRGDVAMQWVRQIVLALHWWNPAVHWMVRRADEAAEGACDDAVLVRGADPSTYARALLSFAERGWAHPAAPVPTIAGRSGLERRVLATIDARRRRRAAGRADRVVPRIAGICGGLLVALAWPRLTLGGAPRAAVAALSAPGAVVFPAPRGLIQSIITESQQAEAQPPALSPQASSDTTDALVGLGAALHDANPIVRAAAARALASWRSDASLARLHRVAAQPIAERRVAALAAIAAMESSR